MVVKYFIHALLVNLILVNRKLLNYILCIDLDILVNYN